MNNNSLTILPSDVMARVFNTFTEKNPHVPCPIVSIEMTPIYNWYVDNIEKYLNDMHKQSLALLFKFIAEQYIIQVADTVFYLHSEALIHAEEYNINDPDVLIHYIEPFIVNNAIPYKEDIGLFIAKMCDNKRLDQLSNRVLGILRSHSLPLYYPFSRMDLEIDWYTEQAMHLPIRWDDITLDPALHARGDIFQYRRSYPYDKKLVLYIGSLPLVANSYFKVPSLGYIIEDCTRPIQVDMEKDIYV